MARRNPVVLFLLALFVIPAVLLAALMMKTHTIIDMPQPGQDMELSGLSYKAHAFEAKIGSLRLDIKSDEDAKRVKAEWIFAGSNTDGQMHRVEMEIRLRDASAEQIDMFTHHCMLTPGAHDQKCAMETKTSAEKWKAAHSVEIVANWLS
jgi:hypothetical protein